MQTEATTRKATREANSRLVDRDIRVNRSHGSWAENYTPSGRLEKTKDVGETIFSQVRCLPHVCMKQNLPPGMVNIHIIKANREKHRGS
jgi:hypothetical protein